MRGCNGDIGNNNGHLACNGGYNNGYGGYNNGNGRYNNGNYNGNGTYGRHRHRDRDDDNDNGNNNGRYNNNGYGNYGIPVGSYQQSCSNMRMRGSTLSASCSAGNGQQIFSSIDVNRCNSSGNAIWNDNGRLRC